MFSGQLLVRKRTFFSCLRTFTFDSSFSFGSQQHSWSRRGALSDETNWPL